MWHPGIRVFWQSVLMVPPHSEWERRTQPIRNLWSSLQKEGSIPGITQSPTNPDLIKRSERLALIVEAQGQCLEPRLFPGRCHWRGFLKEVTWPWARAVTFSSGGVFYLCQPTCVSHDGSWHLPEGNNYHRGGKKERCGARCWLQITLQIHLNCSIVKIWNLEPRWLVFEERAYFKTQDVPNNIYIWIRRSLSASDRFTVSPGINWQGVTTLWLIAW